MSIVEATGEIIKLEAFHLLFWRTSEKGKSVCGELESWVTFICTLELGEEKQ